MKTQAEHIDQHNRTPDSHARQHDQSSLTLQDHRSSTAAQLQQINAIEHAPALLGLQDVQTSVDTSPLQLRQAANLGTLSNVVQLGRKGGYGGKHNLRSNKTKHRVHKQQQQRQNRKPKKKSNRARRREAERRRRAQARQGGGFGGNTRMATFFLMLLIFSSMIDTANAIERGRPPNQTPRQPNSLPQSLNDVNPESLSRFNETEWRSNELSNLRQMQETVMQQPGTAETFLNFDALSEQMHQVSNMSRTEYEQTQTSVNPSQGKGRVVGIVGLPGSGKSSLQNGFEENGYVVYDDIFRDETQFKDVKRNIANKDNVVMSDIQFTDIRIRKKVERQLGKKVDWIWFENNPEQAKKNSVYRQKTTHPKRNVQFEHDLIDRFSRLYKPEGPTHPVFVTPQLLERTEDVVEETGEDVLDEENERHEHDEL